MFGLEFLFSAALWALPLAGLPVVLHLLFRRKSPVIPFSTLRFVKASLQRTAARRRVHRWLLLATRILLLALLIWAIAQPARMLAAQWFGATRGVVAAIVVDTSYSNELRERQQTLLATADAAITRLLSHELAGASVAIYPSRPDPASEKLRSASEILSQWQPLAPQPASKPLVDRIESAIAMLQAQQATDRWLIILSDLQAREFPRPIPPNDQRRTVLLDLHPDEPRSVGVSGVQLDPPQPIPGIQSKVRVDLVGRSGDSRAVTLHIATPQGRQIAQLPARLAHLDASGRAQVEFPVQLVSDRWQLITAQLQGEDAMPWDDARDLLLEVPPVRTVTVLNVHAPAASARYVALALDPNEGQLAAWPLRVRTAEALTGDESAVVALLGKWPDLPTLQHLRQVAQRGGTVVLMLQPGLERSWQALPDPQRQALANILPGSLDPEPTNDHDDYQVSVAAAGEEAAGLFTGLMEGEARMAPVTGRRLVRFSTLHRGVQRLLMAEPRRTSGAGGQRGWLFRQSAGHGAIYTLATLPDRTFTDLPIHPAFLPMLVRLTLPAAPRDLSHNVELGQDLRIIPTSSTDQLELEGPDGQRHRVNKGADGAFTFTAATSPGLYRWYQPGNEDPVAMTRVQPSAAESELGYRAAEQVVATDEFTIVVRSYDALRDKLQSLAEPSPRWSTPIALVLLFLCAEAALGAGLRPKQ